MILNRLVPPRFCKLKNHQFVQVAENATGRDETKRDGRGDEAGQYGKGRDETSIEATRHETKRGGARRVGKRRDETRKYDTREETIPDDRGRDTRRCERRRFRRERFIRDNWCEGNTRARRDWQKEERRRLLEMQMQTQTGMHTQMRTHAHGTSTRHKDTQVCAFSRTCSHTHMHACLRLYT